MSDHRYPKSVRRASPIFNLSGEESAFLRDDGLDVLYAFRSTRDKQTRDLIVEFAKTIVDDQPKTDGH